MNIFTEYINYLKDNPEGYWFKRKLFGWGWTPATWQGWAITVGVIALIVGNAFRLDQSLETDTSAVVELFGETALLVTLLIVICLRTGERPRWTWGVPKNESNHENHSGGTTEV